MMTNHQWLERATLLTEYKACVEHLTALATANLDSVRRDKPTELTDAARLNCDAVRARLASHKNAESGLSQFEISA
jgi:hypothetical protein